MEPIALTSIDRHGTIQEVNKERTVQSSEAANRIIGLFGE